MRELLFKYLPIVASMAMIALLFILEAGPPRKLVIGGLVAFAVLLWIATLISKGLPAQPTMIPTTDEIGVELVAICERLKKLGFEQVGPPVHVNVMPTALLVGFVHSREPMYATAFVAGSPKVTTFDIVSALDGDRGGLTSSPNPRAGTFPSERGGLRQILPNGAPEAVFEMHVESLAYLCEQGLPARALEAATFAGDFTRFLQMQRAAFLRAPFLYAAVALKRSMIPTTRYSAPIREQRDGRRELFWILNSNANLPRASARFRSGDHA